jgi:hypothetical protein
MVHRAFGRGDVRSEHEGLQGTGNVHPSRGILDDSVHPSRGILDDSVIDACSS